MKVIWSFTRQAFHNNVIYRVEYWMQLISSLLMMYSIHWIWKTLYTEHPDSFVLSLEQMTSYGVLGMALETVFNPGQGPQMYISSQIKSGSIETDLIKPLDFHLHMLARNFGEFLFRLCTIVLPAIFIGFMFLHLQPPSSVIQGFLFGISLLLGYLILFSLNFLLGLVSIFTLDLRNITWAYNSLVRFFSGQMVPIWLFPVWLGSLAGFLPFKCIYYIPLTIYTGNADSNRFWILKSLMFEVIWIFILVAMSRWVWEKVKTKIIVQGG